MSDAGALDIVETVVAAIVRHARDEAPDECCGLLLGRPGRIEVAVPARNVRRSSSRYRVHPEDHFRAIRTARDRGLTVLGAYHSHPASEADPSSTDLAEASYPEYVYAIVSLAGSLRSPVASRALRAFRLADEGSSEVPLVVVAP